MKIHKFKIGNPCGPCEWHISSGVRIFAWFDFIFQVVFIVPVVLQFKIFLNQDLLRNCTAKDCECYASQAHLAINYSVADILNLSLGIVSDIFLYVGSKQTPNCATVSITCGWVFVAVAFFRQVMHATTIIFHVLRCKPITYPYEIVTRILCQYLLYGMWISIEYLIWLHNGCKFVPRRGLMEPPVEVLVTTKLTTATIALSEDVSQASAIGSTPISAGDLAVDEKEVEGVKPMQRSSKHKRKFKKNSVPVPPDVPPVEEELPQYEVVNVMRNDSKRNMKKK